MDQFGRKFEFCGDNSRFLDKFNTFQLSSFSGVTFCLQRISILPIKNKNDTDEFQMAEHNDLSNFLSKYSTFIF
jgi:hypothetical protein